MIPTIVVYSKSSNRAGVRLLDGETPIDLSGVDKIALEFDGGRLISSEDDPDVFRWIYNPTGVIYLYLGTLDFITSAYNAALKVYDPLHSSGLFFGYIRIRTIDSPVD